MGWGEGKTLPPIGLVPERVEGLLIGNVLLGIVLIPPLARHRPLSYSTLFAASNGCDDTDVLPGTLLCPVIHIGS
jgi:hypothetical protein